MIPIPTSERTDASPDAGMPTRRAEDEAGYPPLSVNDEDLLRELVYKHSDRLQRFIMKHIGNATEAEELAQQAFVEAAAAYKCFRGESQLSSWLYGIALNLVRNYLSRAPERRHAFVSDAVLETQTSADLSSEDQAAQNQTMALLNESVNG
jgi:RNA polymerase sigma-70 factor (ECF subfamily)